MDASGDSPKHQKATCTCANPVHFLGRCQVEIEPTEKLCAQCLKDHFTRNDDPTIVIE
jgi:hypothetical protein